MPEIPTLETPESPPEPIGAGLLSHWRLDPNVAYLNHGCFGATPRVVLDAQTAWRDRLEARPIELLERARRELLAGPKRSVADLVGVDPDDFGFVTNATGGVNAVLRSLRFEPGDEIVSTDHVYNAVRQTVGYVAGRASARAVVVPVPLPVESAGRIIEQVSAALTERTRLLLIDHIGSPTAVLFPVRQLVELCNERGIDVLVDGAHAPGMLDLDVAGLGAAYYTGNLHKWVCAPKGAAFLWVRPDRQPGIHPTTISHFLDEGLAEEFQWQGTRDITAWLCAKDAIEFMAGLGWPAVRRHNHALAVWAQAMLARRWGVNASTPADGSMLGSMATLPLPEGVRERYADCAALQACLYDHHRIEVPIFEWNDRWWVRVSCQVYNLPEQYVRLGDAVMEMAGG